MKAWVYILQDDSGKYYVGSTTNLHNRHHHHLEGHTPSTAHYQNLKIVLSQPYNSLSDARKIENRIKKLKRRDYIDKIIDDGFIKMKP